VSAAGNETAVHASAVVVDNIGVLIRGPAGSGKSSLALALIHDREAKGVLVGDDRVVLTRKPTGVAIRPAPATAGLIEVRGIGIVPIAHRSEARLGLVVDLLPIEDCPRLPEDEDRRTTVCGLEVLRLALPIGTHDAALRVRIALRQWIDRR
jgi:serine kinase of HPr protein (carbohydrate metabolism regulator)